MGVRIEHPHVNVLCTESKIRLYAREEFGNKISSVKILGERIHSMCPLRIDAERSTIPIANCSSSPHSLIVTVIDLTNIL
jgi:hypothetical protein